MVHAFVSPRGVTAVIQLDEYNAIDAKNPLAGLNNSYSWVGNGNEEESIHERMDRVQKRLDWLREQKSKDQQDHVERLAKAKNEYRTQLEGELAPVMESNVRNNKAKTVVETQKIIQYLKDDNSRLRQEIKTYKKEMATLKKQNAQLEQANQKAEAARKELQDHVTSLEVAQAKLQQNCEIFKQALQDMRVEYKKRKAHYNAELRSEKVYENCMAKILAHVKNNSTSATILEETYQIAGDGAEDAAQCRDDVLSKHGLVREVETVNILQAADDGNGDDGASSSDDSDTDSDDE